MIVKNECAVALHSRIKTVTPMTLGESILRAPPDERGYTESSSSYGGSFVFSSKNTQIIVPTSWRSEVVDWFVLQAFGRSYFISFIVTKER